MGKQTSGVGAEVGVKKMNKDGKVTQREGAAKKASRLAWAVFYSMLVLSVLGLWKVFDLVTAVI